MRFASLVRSGPFKVALAFAGAVVVTTYLVFALVYLRFYSLDVVFLHSVLKDEITSAQTMPTDRLKRRLEARLTQDLRHLDYVGLYDRDGRLSFGNVDSNLHIATDEKAHLVTTRAPQPEDRGPESAVFVAAKRSDGGTLVLGRSMAYVQRLQHAMLLGSAASLIPVILLALLIGVIVSRRASLRLSALQTAIDRVMEGELHVRLPARGSSDDIEHLVAAVNKMLDEIVRLLHQLKSVGDNIAHDLRAPLAVMRARLERGLASPSEGQLRGLAAEALGDLERAMTTVTALLRISELESGLRRSAFDSVDLVLVCRDVYDLYEPLAASRGVILRCETDEPVVVTGDGDLLREAVANLVDNAVKFTPVGGAVTVGCGGPHSLIRVSDTGAGIPPGEREKVLKRFYRAKSARDVPGVGLGLSMATTIIELHGFGLVIRDNEPGAVFDITREPSYGDALAASSQIAPPARTKAAHLV